MAGCFMQCTPATLGIELSGQQPGSCSSQVLDPRFVVIAELLLQIASQALRQGRTLSTSGDRNLELSATHYRRIIKIAVLGVVDHVAQDAEPLRLAKDRVIDSRGRR